MHDDAYDGSEHNGSNPSSIAGLEDTGALHAFNSNRRKPGQGNGLSHDMVSVAKAESYRKRRGPRDTSAWNFILMMQQNGRLQDQPYSGPGVQVWTSKPTGAQIFAASYADVRNWLNSGQDEPEIARMLEAMRLEDDPNFERHVA